MPFEQRHHGSDPLDDVLLLGSLEHVEQRDTAVTLDEFADALDRLSHHRGELLRVEIGALEEAGHLAQQMIAQPRNRRELDAVSLLVQADPESEVLRVDVEFALDVHDVRGHQQEPALVATPASSLLQNGSNWPSTLLDRIRQQATRLEAGDARADRSRHPGVRQALFASRASWRRAGGSPA